MNIPGSKRILLILLHFVFAAGNAFAQSNKVENALFWEVSGNGLKAPSYLFGTYHVLNSGYLKEVPHVEEAFEKAEGVVVETEIDSAKMLQLMTQLVMKNKKLSDLLNDADYKLVSNEFEKTTGMTMDMFGQFKPVMVTISLTMAYNQKSNGEFLSKYGGHPLDSYFASAAKKSNRPVSTFESMQEQLDIVFNHDPVDEQAKQLVEFVKTKNEMIDVQIDLTNMYVKQDLKGMYSIYKKYEKQFGDASYLLDDRNVKWMEKLPAILQSGNQFIAVGALHFTGEKGLIKLLREAGYMVKPLAVN